MTFFFYCTNRQISSSSIQRYRSGKSSAVGSIFPGRSKSLRDQAQCIHMLYGRLGPLHVSGV